MKNVVLYTCLALFTLTSNAQSSFFKKLEKKKVISTNDVLWQQVGPGNAGYANLLRYHPTLPGVIAQCPDMWNAYQSENNGKRWYGITDPDGKADFYHLRDLYYSITDANFGLAIGSSELWKTQNMGKSWEVVKNCPWYKKDFDGNDKNKWKKKIGSLAIDPNHKNVWYVGGGTNVRGQEWMSCYKDITAAKPRGRNSINEGKLWKTKNGGKSWSLINKGLHPKAQIGRVIINPKNSQQIFASSNYGLYRSDNGGKKWRQISKGKLDNDIIMDMDYYYDAKTKKFVLYLIDQTQYIPRGKTTACTGGIFYSENEGKTWENVTDDLTLDINQLSGGVPKNYYKYISNWFGISVKKAKAMYPKLPTKALQRFNMISGDPSREGAMYVGFADPQTGGSIMPGRLWTTNNYGKKWISTARLYQDAWEKDKKYWESRGNPTHENMKVGHSSPHMRFGKDYALRSMRGLDVGVDGSVMIVSDHSTMLSEDYGATWKQVDEELTPSGAIVGTGNSNLPALVIAQDKRFETTLLGSGEHRLWIPSNDSSDKRVALKFIESAQATVSNLVFDPYNAKVVYATSNRQEEKQYLFKSIDGGLSWAKHGVATPATNKFGDDFFTNGLLIDPKDSNYMYFGTTQIESPNKAKDGGFFFSKNNGKSFEQRNKGLPSPARINDVQFDPRDTSGKSLFIAAEKNIHNYVLPLSEGGLYHSSDRGLNWKKVKTPNSIEGVQFVKIDHTNRMYITTGYRGGGSGVWYSDNFGKSWKQIFKPAGTECIDVSPFDHNLLVVTVKFNTINPGIYMSKNRGKSWVKINKNIGIPHQIEDVKFDIHNASKMWLASKGCGFYRGQINGGDKVQAIEVLPKVTMIRDKNKIQLKTKILNQEFENQALIWKSDNPSIATVDKNGLVSPIGKGSVKVWATTKEGRFSDFSVITILP